MTRKRLCLIIAVVCLMVAAIFCCLGIPWPQGELVTEQFAPTTVPTTESSQTITSTTTPLVSDYHSPIDFASAQSHNPDVYAWLTVPGTPINYPIVQHPEDDGYYLDHNSDRQPDANGAIFSERLYNSTDFTDAVTVLYGHDMMSGDMFGELQTSYSDPAFLKENDEIIVYLPDREIHFEIFAAMPYSRMHLLHYYQTEKQSAFDLLINDIYSTRKISAQLIEERRPEYGDQVIVLSTCLSGDNHYRYLVMGVAKSSQ